jgi:hypothetical protein
MELTGDRLKAAFSSNSIIRKSVKEAQGAEGKRIFYLLHFLLSSYLRIFDVAFAVLISLRKSGKMESEKINCGHICSNGDRHQSTCLSKAIHISGGSE